MNNQPNPDPVRRFEVLTHLLPAVVYADGYDPAAHGCTPKECEEVARFVDAEGVHWAPVEDAEYPGDYVQSLAKCDVTGEIGWCVEIEKA